MDIKSELRKVRDSHKAEEQRLRQLAEEALREADRHASRIQAYEVALSDPMLDSAGQQLTLGLPDGNGGSTTKAKRGKKKRPAKGRSMSLIDCVRTIISSRRGDEFNSHDLVEPIEELAPGLLASLQPKALTKILWRLATLGEIHVVQEGGGGKPAVYHIPS